MAEVCRDAGYATYLSGKWHLAVDMDNPNPAWPTRRGFDRFFGTLDDIADWEGKPIAPPPELVGLLGEARDQVEAAGLHADFMWAAGEPGRAIVDAAREKGDGWLSPSVCEALLDAAAVPVVRSGAARTADEAAAAAKALGFPRQIAHGMWTKARSVAAVENRMPEQVTVDVAFKKPILLPGTVAFGHEALAGDAAGDQVFALTRPKDGAPHLVGRATRVT